MASEQHAVPVPVRIALRPVESPYILGLYGFSGAWLVVSMHLAGWYGSPRSPLYLFPLVGFLGGLAQLTACFWAYRARDALATVVMALWGSFWLSYGLLYWLTATGTLAPHTGPWPELAFWYVVLAWISAACTWAAAAHSWSLTATLAGATVGSLVAAVGYFTGNLLLGRMSGYAFLVTALLGAYTGTAIMYCAAFGREVLPVGWTRIAQERPRIAPAEGEPGVSRRG